MVRSMGERSSGVMRSIGERPAGMMKPSSVRTSIVVRSAGVRSSSVVGSARQVRSAGVVWCTSVVRRLNVKAVSDVAVGGSVSEAIARRTCGVTEGAVLPRTVTAAAATVGEGSIASAMGRRQVSV